MCGRLKGWIFILYCYSKSSVGLFSVADSKSFLSPKEILRDILGKLREIFLLFHENVFCVYSYRHDSNECTQHTITL